jgi:hypothetical protein
VIEPSDLRILARKPRMLGAEEVPAPGRAQRAQPLAPQRLGERRVRIAVEEGAHLGGLGALELGGEQPVVGIGFERMAREARARGFHDLRVAARGRLAHGHELGFEGRGGTRGQWAEREDRGDEEVGAHAKLRGPGNYSSRTPGARALIS